MPAGTERASAAVAASNGKIYVAGGVYCHEGDYGLRLSIPNTERNDMFSVYDPATNTFRARSPTVGIVPTFDTFTPGVTSCSYD